MIYKRDMKVVVISGANLYSGGTLSIFQDCLKYLDLELAKEYKIIAIVFDKSLFKNYKNIKFIEIKNIRNSYLHRLYFEYFYFYKISKKLNPFFWLSLNDISPNVVTKRRAVYCHNPSPFRRITIKDLWLQKEVFFFTLFYKHLYRINLNKNNFIIVQQNWIRDSFIKMFSLEKDKILLFPPKISDYQKYLNNNSLNNSNRNQFLFIYPTLPRPFKNIELICEAVKCLTEIGVFNFSVIITIDGSENNYSSNLLKKYKKFKQINFIGFITREEVFNYYSKSDCLIFPSTLETWGLPITEFKLFNKPILLSDLEYAHETLGKYNKASFFNPRDPNELASKIVSFINNDLVFENHDEISYDDPLINNWDNFFKHVLK
jgi:glycosyltransferase involved in cell wall biosynthesis